MVSRKKYRASSAQTAVELALILLLGGAASCWAQAGGAGNTASLPSGPGRDEFVSSCSTCHALGVATGKRHTPEEWRAIIQEMIGRGAQLDSNQAATIQKYLSDNFAATESPATAIARSPSEPAPAKPDLTASVAAMEPETGKLKWWPSGSLNWKRVRIRRPISRFQSQNPELYAECRAHTGPEATHQAAEYMEFKQQHAGGGTGI